MRWKILRGLLPGLVVAVGVLAVQPAQAQSPPPPVTPCANTGTIDLGVHNIGEVLGAVLCGPWFPSTPVSLVYDGRGAGSKGALSNGTINASVSLISLAQNAVDDVVPGQCGQNTLVATGTHFSGTGTATSGIIFTINCVNGVPTVVTPGTVTPVTPAVISPTLGNQQQQQQQQQQKVTVEGAKAAAPAATATAAATAAGGGAATPGTGGGRVAFTGANILRTSLAAMAMVGVGALLLLRSRRRLEFSPE